jgi:hypothetical protein
MPRGSRRRVQESKLNRQAPETTEPPIGLEPRYALLLRSPTVYEILGALNAFD